MKYKSHDIGKVLGVLMIGSGIREALESVFAILFGVFRPLDFWFILALIVGIALYQHLSWARLFTLWFSCLAAVICVAIGIIYPLNLPGVTTEFTIRGEVIKHAALWQVYVFLAFALFFLGLIVYFLRTEKARSEFGVV